MSCQVNSFVADLHLNEDLFSFKYFFFPLSKGLDPLIKVVLIIRATQIEKRKWPFEISSHPVSVYEWNQYKGCTFSGETTNVCKQTVEMVSSQRVFLIAFLAVYGLRIIGGKGKRNEGNLIYYNIWFENVQ